jgi:capsular polysaccharide biosynthesis protein
MAAARRLLLEALLEHNSRYGVSTAIWGEGAASAAEQALAAVAAPLPPCRVTGGATALRLDTPLDLAYAVRCDQPERLHFPLQGGMPGLASSPLSLEVALLEQAVVREWQGYHLLHQGGELVADGSSAYWPLAWGGLAGAGVLPLGEPQQREELAEAFLVCDDLDTGNFCHFVCDLLPKIALAGECRRRIPIVIEPPSQPFQRELLARVGERCGHPIVPLEPGLELAVERLFYLRRVGHTHPLLRCSGLAMGWVRELVDARPEPAPADSLLYVRRQRRRVLNEEALIGALQRHTPRLQVVDALEPLAVRAQAELVGRHRLLVGPHGAGFTHLLFAREAPQRALELMAEGNGSLAFALISGRLGLEHGIHVGRAVGSSNGANYPDLEVDVDGVLAALSA